MQLLISGDIVGSPGRIAFARIATRMRAEGKVDFIVANAENAAGGKGITLKIANELFAAGADALTLGDHAFDQKEFVAEIDKEPRILRPANLAPGCPGKGWITVSTPMGKITIIDLVGRVFMGPTFDCPFRAADSILSRRDELGKIILVDIHAEATSEKVAMGRYLDGRVSAVVGTHTHIQTSDEDILGKGTAYLTDLGMTGPKDSVIGCEADTVIRRFLTGMPVSLKVATDKVSFEGALIEIDESTGKAKKIKRIREFI